MQPLVRNCQVLPMTKFYSGVNADRSGFSFFYYFITTALEVVR